MCTRLLRSKLAKFGLPSRSITMVGMFVQLVTLRREISRPATSRSHRGMTTRVPALMMTVCSTLTVPVMWNIGTTASTTVSDELRPHSWQA
jgi:hypothetical protein